MGKTNYRRVRAVLTIHGPPPSRCIRWVRYEWERFTKIYDYIADNPNTGPQLVVLEKRPSIRLSFSRNVLNEKDSFIERERERERDSCLMRRARPAALNINAKEDEVLLQNAPDNTSVGVGLNNETGY
ncbi:hypothetical protein EVAR_54008_1 [Eumeta japonica]|uniref:Uncharacterized protein n=1 Tax=Eumeta variegata TaxID=151549 RepID=A0A4C1XV98_EUMVA|nr:hypothetical protein EVAR_54008_1 [Eumeta japonica]